MRRKKRKPTKAVITAQAETAALLERVGYTGSGISKRARADNWANLRSDPLPTRSIADCSDDIGGTGRKKNTDYKHGPDITRRAIAPAYNKGAYQVVSKSDLPTAGRKI